MGTFSDLAAGMNAAAISTFAEPCTYAPATALAFTINLILKKPIEGDADYPGAYLRASGITSAFETSPQKGDRVTIGSETYIVFAVREDEAGMTVLLLNKC